jgi:hypothetical protein
MAASRKDMRRADLSTWAPPLPIPPSPIQRASSARMSRANLTLQSCRTPNRPRTSQTATWPVSTMCCVQVALGADEAAGTLGSTLPMAAVSAALCPHVPQTADMVP